MVVVVQLFNIEVIYIRCFINSGIYMGNRLKNIMNAAVSEIVLLTIISCLVVIRLSWNENGHWEIISTTAAIIGGIVLISWIIWVVTIILSKKIVKDIPLKYGIVIETLSWLFLFYYIYISKDLVSSLIWLPLIIWNIYRSITIRKKEV